MNNKKIKKILSLSTVSLLFLQLLYLVAEPTIVTAISATDSVLVTLDVTSGISISNGADSTMSPNIGVSGDKSVGSSSWNVITNNVGGYNLTVAASAAPALVRAGGGDSFADYTEATPGTPALWAGTIASGTKEFGFSVYGGTSVNSTTWGSYSSCGNIGTGVPDVAAKYRGFTGTTPIAIANKSTITTTAGESTSICFAAEQNGTYAQNGNYAATITGTATTQ